MSRHLAIDIGASGGKAFVGEFSGGSFSLTEVGRFPNGPVEIDGRLRWDMPNLIRGIRACILGAIDQFGKAIDSVGIDTWGVDFGLLGKDGELIDWPYAYRDPLVSSTVDEVYGLIQRKELFDRTGIQHLPFNTIFQLHLTIKNPSWPVEDIEHMLLMPGLFTHLAGGRAAVDATIASTTQLIDIHTADWAYDIAEKLGIPARILPEIVPAGTIAGEFGGAIGEGIDLACAVVHSAGHDTAAAVAAFDFAKGHPAYLSTGSWFLAGCLSNKPLLGEDAYDAGLTNERAADGRFRVLKNVIGLYLMQECQRKWDEEGGESDTVKLVEVASEAEPFGPLIDPDAPSLMTPGDVPEKIIKLIQDSGQEAPVDTGGLLRCIFESIALKTGLVLERIFNVAGVSPTCLRVGGGGARNELLCEMLAGATGLEVVAGPMEAAAVGNAVVQAVALGEIPSIQEGAGIVSGSLPMKSYGPRDEDAWKDAGERFLRLFTVKER